MTQLALNELFLTAMISFGAPIFGLTLLAGGIGVPLPCTLLVIAAGAFIRQGLLDLPVIFLVGLLCVVIGDSLSFAAGRLAKGPIERRWGETPRWINARQRFCQHAPAAIVFSRFLFTPLALPVNLIAGNGSYSFWRFFLFDTLGEFVWLTLYGSAGYIFWTQWEVVSELAGDLSGLLLGLLALVSGAAYLYKHNKSTSIHL